MLSGKGKTLSQLRIILGSKSVARAGLIDRTLGLKYEIIRSSFEEDLDKSKFNTVEDYCMATCQGKIDDLRAKVGKYDILITCDTVCVDDQNNIVEKPDNLEEQKEFMRRFSGTYHSVVSALIVSIWKDGKEIIERHTERTKVWFGDLPQSVIENYGLENPGTLKSSGGYQVQEFGFSMIEKIEGCYGNIVGLPVNGLSKILIKHF